MKNILGYESGDLIDEAPLQELILSLVQRGIAVTFERIALGPAFGIRVYFRFATLNQTPNETLTDVLTFEQFISFRELRQSNDAHKRLQAVCKKVLAMSEFSVKNGEA